LRRRTRVLSLCALFVLLSAMEVRAADQEIAGVRVTVASVITGEGGATLRRVVISAVVLKLDQLGLEVAESALDQPGSPEMPESVMTRAKSREDDFVLFARLAPTENDVSIDLRLYLVPSGQEVARARSVEALELTLDRAVGDLTVQLLDEARSFLVAAASQRSGAESTRAGEAASAETGQAVTLPEGPPAAPSRDRILAFAGGFAPLVPVEASADYMGLSMGATASLMLLPFSSDTFGFGVMGRFVTGRARGAAADLDLVLIPIAGVVQVAATGSPVRPFARVAGGIALLRASNDSLGDRLGIIPYAAADLGVTATLLGVFGLEAAVGFEAYFEGSILIMGFAPALSVVLEI